MISENFTFTYFLFIWTWWKPLVWLGLKDSRKFSNLNLPDTKLKWFHNRYPILETIIFIKVQPLQYDMGLHTMHMVNISITKFFCPTTNRNWAGAVSVNTNFALNMYAAVSRNHGDLHPPCFVNALWWLSLNSQPPCNTSNSHNRFIIASNLYPTYGLVILHNNR